MKKNRFLLLLVVVVVCLSCLTLINTLKSKYHSDTDIMSCKERIVIPRENVNHLIQTPSTLNDSVIYCPHLQTVLIYAYEDFEYTVFLGGSASVHDVCGEETVRFEMKEPGLINVPGTGEVAVKAIVIFPVGLIVLQ